MKKTFWGIVCSLLLVVALPGMAFASDSSPTNTGSASQVITNEDGTTDTFTAAITDKDASSKSQMSTSTNHASNYDSEGSSTNRVVGSFTVSPNDNLSDQDGELGEIPVTVNVGKKYAGKIASVYVDYSNGDTAELSPTVADDGTISFTLKTAATFTVAIDGEDVSSGNTEGLSDDSSAGQTGTNTSATSPQTGISFAAVSFATLACAVAAAFVACLYRRKCSE